jgi:N-acetyl-anhydromuramyl-L-alanine amidase AmpD
MYGQSYNFQIVTSTVALGAADFSAIHRQKSQIVLHCTAGNGSAEDVLNWWNNPASGAASAHFIVERTHTPQVARPGGGPAADASDAGLVDVVRCLDEDVRSFHAENVNSSSIGIEIVNVGWGWYTSSNADEPSLAGRHPLAGPGACPSPTNIGTAAAPRWVCNHARPTDTNRYIRLAPAIGGYTDWQAFEDEQYTALALLLRYLCIGHRIPRNFIGTNRTDIFRHYEHDGTAAERRVYRTILFRFRGIFEHRNAHRNKICPGILDRSRLYRAITDEWWLPVARDATPRPYYSGPFEQPAYVAGNPSRNSYFRFQGGRIQGVVYRAAELDPLIETRSYYDLDQVNTYYADTETRLGGMFPVGVNKVWHGGVHLPAPAANPCVFAAASGMIVAARLSSNADTDAHASFGSQRFVLIRHAIYRQLQADPGGLGQRINYGADPVFVFSLYMHLAAVRDLANEHDENPPWFNMWRRNNPAADAGMDGEKGRVFAPNIPVAVGDILGFAGTFRGRRIIHFEIISHRNNELTGAPWDDAAKRFEDTDANVVCNVAALDRYLRDQVGDGIDVVDVLRAARELRNVKAMHKSEWALTAEAEIEPLVPHPDRRRVLWPHFSRFSWVSEAIAANARLRNDLGDAAGMFWHYHPITFMHHMNTLVTAENREVPEAADHDINVETDEDYFLTNFVDWNAAPPPGAFRAAGADNDRVHPSFVSSADFVFRRRDIACFQAGAHAPGATPPEATKFSLALLEVLQLIRNQFNAGIDITLSHVCDAHAGNNALCVMNNAGTMASHRSGIAVDIRPTNRTPATCRNLWNNAMTIINTVNTQYPILCGAPSQANFPAGYNSIGIATSAVVDAKLRAAPQQALTAAEAAAFRMHMSLIAEAAAVAVADTSDLPVRLNVVIEEILVLNDQEAGSGDWYMQASVNGALVGSFSDRQVDDGDVLTVSWAREVTIDPNGSLTISVTGYDEDVTTNESLGSVSLTYNRNSSPPWNMGRSTARSSNGSFRITLNIESLNVQEY